MVMKKTVVKAANDGDGQLALKWLKARQRDRYHERVEELVDDQRLILRRPHYRDGERGWEPKR